jgi:hypothetical protein
VEINQPSQPGQTTRDIHIAASEGRKGSTSLRFTRLGWPDEARLCATMSDCNNSVCWFVSLFQSVGTLCLQISGLRVGRLNKTWFWIQFYNVCLDSSTFSFEELKCDVAATKLITVLFACCILFCLVKLSGLLDLWHETDLTPLPCITIIHVLLHCLINIAVFHLIIKPSSSLIIYVTHVWWRCTNSTHSA